MSRNPEPLPRGSEPWDLEPSFLKWREPTTGLKCIMWRNPVTKTLCGYVRVMRNHPMYGRSMHPRFRWVQCPDCGGFHADKIYCAKDLSVTALRRLKVHGGVTYSGKFKTRFPIVKSFEGRFWVGFDTGHAGDLTPGVDEMMEKRGFFMPSKAFFGLPPDTYRNWTYVKAQTESLARQLGKMLP